MFSSSYASHFTSYLADGAGAFLISAAAKSWHRFDSQNQPVVRCAKRLVEKKEFSLFKTILVQCLQIMNHQPPYWMMLLW